MARVTWTTQALDDLDGICSFIARDAPRNASMFADRVFGAVERLEDFPQAGRVVPELRRSEIREVIVGNYRIVYRYLYDEVELLMVFHAARLITSHEGFEDL